MPIIQLQTTINAPIERVFNLSRSIDLHQVSTAHTNEKAIAGKTSGRISLNESVTWRAKHFGVYLLLTSKITAFNSPTYFVDEMQEGPFKAFKHEHIFTADHDKTILIDIFDYTSPYGVLGKLVDLLFLKRYMTQLLKNRNRVIKQVAESEQWKRYL